MDRSSVPDEPNWSSRAGSTSTATTAVEKFLNESVAPEGGTNILAFSPQLYASLGRSHQHSKEGGVIQNQRLQYDDSTRQEESSSSKKVKRNISLGSSQGQSLSTLGASSVCNVSHHNNSSSRNPSLPNSVVMGIGTTSSYSSQSSKMEESDGAEEATRPDADRDASSSRTVNPAPSSRFTSTTSGGPSFVESSAFSSPGSRYTLEQRHIGAGNFGTCCLVKSKQSGELYVCKTIDMSHKTRAQQQECENEVNTMSKLNHPNTIGFIEAFTEADSVLHIIMEYADGTDLEKRLNELRAQRSEVGAAAEKMTETEIMDMFVQILFGLHQLHTQEYVHRDLKCANVMLCSSGSVKIGDFGFSKKLSSDAEVVREVCGTPYYFSPELCQKLPYNNKSDVWSLGVILYEMINLRKPFEANNIRELRRRIINDEPAPFTNLEISSGVKDLCLLLLEKSVESRPATRIILTLPVVRDCLAKKVTSLNQQLKDAKIKAVKAASSRQKSIDQDSSFLTTTLGSSGGDSNAKAHSEMGEDANKDDSDEEEARLRDALAHRRSIRAAKLMFNAGATEEYTNRIRPELKSDASSTAVKAEEDLLKAEIKAALVTRAPEEGSTAHTRIVNGAK